MVRLLKSQGKRRITAQFLPAPVACQCALTWFLLSWRRASKWAPLPYTSRCYVTLAEAGLQLFQGQKIIMRRGILRTSFRNIQTPKYKFQWELPASLDKHCSFRASNFSLKTPGHSLEMTNSRNAGRMAFFFLDYRASEVHVCDFWLRAAKQNSRSLKKKSSCQTKNA